MRLLHVHLPGLTPYPLANSIQSHLLSLHTTHRALLRSTPSPAPSTAPVPPPPTVLTLTTPPTYTVGRRYLTRNPLPSSQIAHLQGLSPNTTTSNPASHLAAHDSGPSPPQPLATFHPTSRGGDLTYHGPGQLTAYAILNLRTHRLTARNYIHLLESVVIRTCSRLGVAQTTTTADPGVWIRDSDPPRKICAVGIQVSSGITSHGIGLNVYDALVPAELRSWYRLEDGEEAPGYLSWGFQRILACGLEGKSVTCLAAEGARGSLREEEVGRGFTEELAKGLSLEGAVNIRGIDRMAQKDVESLIYRCQGLERQQRITGDDEVSSVG